jgi:predicted DsbA family dithiol-disulfide isomerase
MTSGVTERAKEVGLAYNFEEMKSANTVKAHRLTKWAQKNYPEQAAMLTEELLQAYFIDGKAIGQDEELLAIAEKVGLNKEQASNVLATELYANDVNQDILEAREIGVKGVPFFVFNNKWGISGAQPQQLFEQTIEQAAQDAGLKKSIQIVGEGPICKDDSCEL